MPQINPAKLIEDDYSGEWKTDMPDVFLLLNKFNRDVGGALNSTVGFSQLGAQTINLTVTMPSRDIALALGSGWTSVTTPTYSIDSRGWVQVVGTVTGGTTGTTMVSGLPTPDVAKSWATVANNAFGKITLDTSGNLKSAGGSTTNVDFYVSYLAARSAVKAPSCFPITITSKLATNQAGAVLLGPVTDKNSQGGQILQPLTLSLSWHNQTGLSGGSNVNSIVVDNIDGLVAGRTYSVTLYAFPSQ